MKNNKPYTTETFKKKLKELGRDDIEVIGEYINSHTKIKVKCTNSICQHEWETAPTHIIQGHGCPECKRRNLSKTMKTQSQFEKSFEEKGNPNVIVLEKYKGAKVKLKCRCKQNPEHEWYVTPNCLLRKYGCPICGRTKGKDKKNNEQFLEELLAINPDIIPLEEYKGAKENIKLQCRKDSRHIWYNSPTHLLSGQSCPYCCKGHKILKNDKRTLGKECPDLLQYFSKEDKEDAFVISSRSNKKYYFVCPRCGRKKKKTLSVKDLYQYGFSCDYCEDKISFPNKFIRNLAFYLKENKKIDDFELEYCNKLLKKFRYDCLLKIGDKKILIEMNGAQHYYENSNWHKNAFERDKEKRETALKNGFYFVAIDCRKSDFNFIKENLIKSELGILIDFKNVEWEKILITILSSNLVKQISEEYEKNEYYSLQSLKEKFKMSGTAIVKRLKIGAELGLCSYPNKKIKYTKRERIKRYKFQVYKLHKLIGEFNTIKEIDGFIRTKEGKSKENYISQCLKGKRKEYKGYTFIKVNLCDTQA